jgi:hypothetical protein
VFHCAVLVHRRVVLRFLGVSSAEAVRLAVESLFLAFLAFFAGLETRGKAVPPGALEGLKASSL